MAASPAKSNSGTTDTAAATPLSSSASKSLRGMNKPKCIKCGNVARSRCPYQSCKNCCAKAENPCHIHVLKGNSSLPDKPPSSSAPLFDQQSTEVSHSGNFHRLRQLSSNFAQFSNLQTPFRSRKPLTKKDAQVINEWRFLKLKEFKDRNTEAETDAFDQYVRNVGLLEEVFSVNSAADEQDLEITDRTVQGLKSKLGSDLVRSDNLRKRILHIVDQGSRKLGKVESIDGTSDVSDTEGHGIKGKKVKSWQGEVSIALRDLNDKLDKARNEDDLKACREMASEIFRWNTKTSLAEAGDECPLYGHERSCKWVHPSTLDHEALSRIDAQFSSLEEIEDL